MYMSNFDQMKPKKLNSMTKFASIEFKWILENASDVVIIQAICIIQSPFLHF